MQEETEVCAKITFGTTGEEERQRERCACVETRE